MIIPSEDNFFRELDATLFPGKVYILIILLVKGIYGIGSSMNV
jgi:hypothetical protein